MDSSRPTIPAVETHILRSERIGQDFQIQVALPPSDLGGGGRLPVLYLTDGNLSFDFAKGISLILQSVRQAEPFILVSIGYVSPNPLAGMILRWRDFTSTRRPEIPPYPAPPYGDIPRIARGAPRWGGADAFLEFIAGEVAPFIERTYNASGDRTLAGHSIGAGFGLHALVARPSFFDRYLLVSPSVSFNGDDYGLREIDTFLKSMPDLDIRMFLGVGGLEDDDCSPAVQGPRFLASFRKLVERLSLPEIRGLELHHRVFELDTHSSVWPTAFCFGIRVLFGPEGHAPRLRSPSL